MPPAYQQYFEPTYGMQRPTLFRERATAAPLGNRNGAIQHPGRPLLPLPQDLFPPKKSDSGSISPNDSISHTVRRMAKQNRQAKRQRSASPAKRPAAPPPSPSATSRSEPKVLPRGRARNGRKRPAPKSESDASDDKKESQPAVAQPRTRQAQNAIIAAAAGKANAKGKSGVGGGKGKKSTTAPRPAASGAVAPTAKPNKDTPQTHSNTHHARLLRSIELEQKLAELQSENAQLQEDNEELARGVRRLGRRIRDEEQERLRREAAGRAFKDKACMMSMLWAEIMQLEI